MNTITSWYYQKHFSVTKPRKADFLKPLCFYLHITIHGATFRCGQR